MKNTLEYKGYYTRVEYDTDSKVLYGKIEGIKDLVNFESPSPLKVESEFHKAVDDYLVFCEEIGKEPDKEYKGVFNVRIAPELHKKLTIYAFKKQITLNKAVENSIKVLLKIK